MLVPRADIGRDVIADGLRSAGAIVTDVVAYRTVLEEAQQDGGPDIYRMLLDGRIDVVTFTSPSAVRNFSAIYGAEQTIDLLKNTVVAVHRPGDRGRRHPARHRRHGAARGLDHSGARRCHRGACRAWRRWTADELAT